MVLTFSNAKCLALFCPSIWEHLMIFFSFLQLQGVQLTSSIQTILYNIKEVVKAENCFCTHVVVCKSKAWNQTNSWNIE